MSLIGKLDLTNISPVADTSYTPSPEEQDEMEREYKAYVKDRQDLELALAEGRISQETFDQFIDSFK